MNEKKRIHFLKQILTPNEFLDLKQNPKVFQTSLTLYDDDYIDSVAVFPCNQIRFVIPKKDFSNFLPNWQNTLKKLSLQKGLQNPIYVIVEENGTIFID